MIKERSYLAIKAKEVRIVKEVMRSDGLWRFACGDVFVFKAPLASTVFSMHCNGFANIELSPLNVF